MTLYDKQNKDLDDFENTEEAVFMLKIIATGSAVAVGIYVVNSIPILW